MQTKNPYWDVGWTKFEVDASRIIPVEVRVSPEINALTLDRMKGGYLEKGEASWARISVCTRGEIVD
jgi:hypothetical protein